MELDLYQFFRDLLHKHEDKSEGYYGIDFSHKEFEALVEDLVQHARDFRNMP